MAAIVLMGKVDMMCDRRKIQLKCCYQLFTDGLYMTVSDVLQSGWQRSLQMVFPSFFFSSVTIPELSWFYLYKSSQQNKSPYQFPVRTRFCREWNLEFDSNFSVVFEPNSKFHSLQKHCSEKRPYFRDRVPIGTFLTFWVPIGSLFIFQGPYFQCFG